jgi:putative hydrolase of the HAD superfamily
MDEFQPQKIKVIGFDADDTLWVNEPYYRETEEKFCTLLAEYAGAGEINRRLYEVEMTNMELYGYGTKAFMLSLIETAIQVSDGRISPAVISEIIQMGKSQIALKNSLLPGVTEVLDRLSDHYRLIVATKGDLLDQERKLKNSGISGYFHHIEIMTDKREENYRKLLSHLDISAGEFLMVGNSVRSDVIPVVKLGGHAIHIPFHITWQHETAEAGELPAGSYFSVDTIRDVFSVLGLSQ